MPKKATTSRTEWAYVNVPRELMDEVDQIVNGQRSGYRSRSDFVVDAIRRRLGGDREIDQLRSQVQNLAELVQRMSTGEITIHRSNPPKPSPAEAATKRVQR